MRFTYFWPGWAVALGIVIAVGVTTLVYLRIERPLQRRQTLLLITLRVCAVAILLGCLLAPVIIEKRDITPPMHLSVLVDTSQSMRLTDAGNLSRLNQVNELLFGELLFGDSDTENERTLLHTLAERFEVHVYPFDTELHQEESGEGQQTVRLKHIERGPMGALTDIGTALQQVDAAWKGQQRAGIVLFTDGAHNAGELPMEALVALQMPVYALGVGAAEPPKDIQLQRVDVAPVAYTGHEQRIRVTVAQSGYTGQTTRLALREVNRQKVQRLVASTMLTFEEGSQQIEFTLTPETEGNFQYTLTLPTLDGELTSENNEKTFALKVVKAKLSVFYLEGRPRWEYTFLKRALERDPGIEFTSALLSLLSKGPASESVLTRSEGYYPVGSNATSKLSGPEVPPAYARFPETREELSTYDVLIFGDVTAEHLTATQQRLIVDFVETEGNAILFLSSRNALGRSGLRDTELARLMPISVPITGCSLSETEFTVQLTQAGAFHPMLQLSGYTGRGESAVANRGEGQVSLGRRGGNLTPNRNAALWRNLPALSRLFHGFQLRGGATTLLETGLLETGKREPIMIFQRAGLGKSLLFAAEGLWNWDFGAANALTGFGDARYHSLYREVWAQILRWMGTTHTDANRLYLTTDASTYATGDTVQITAQVYSETYQPQTTISEGATVQIEVTPPEGAPFQLRATTISEENRYTARFEVREKGTYHIRATSGAGNTDKTEFYVQPQLAELEAPQLNEALLRQLASQTGGAYFAIADAAQLPENIAFVQDSVFVDTERDVWAHPLVLILVVGLLGTEWFLRKRNGFL